MWFKSKYERAFATNDATYQLIYGDRAQTANVLGNPDFIKAWFASDHFNRVTTIIGNEALAGDIPSIKQMIWLGDQVYQNVPNMTQDAAERAQLQIEASKERIRFCELAISKGLDDRSYQAMGSYARLYALVGAQTGSASSTEIGDILAGIIRNAKIYLASPKADPDYVQEVRDALAHYSEKADFHGAFVSR
jgi:hypothetical protein